MVKKSEAVIQLLQRLDVLDRVRKLYKNSTNIGSLEENLDKGIRLDFLMVFPVDELDYWKVVDKMVQIVLDGVDGYNAEEQSGQEGSDTRENEDDIIRLMKLDGNGYVAEVAGKDYGFEDTERLLTFLMDYLTDRSIVLPENRYFN